MEGTPETPVSATARVRRDPAPERRGADAYVAELVGTLLLTLFVATIFVVHSQGVLGVTDWAVIGLVHLLLLAMLVGTLGAASGGHFNPAVTVTFLALRRIAPVEAAIYVALQLVGALLGVLLVKLVLDGPGDPVAYGAPLIGQALDGEALKAFVLEALGAFALMWAYMGTSGARRRPREWTGLIVGAAFGFVVLCLGPLTGGAVNPARAFAPSLLGGGEPAGAFLVAYVLGPLVGALLAGMVFTAGILGPRDERAPDAA